MIDSCCLIVVSLDTLWGLPFCFPNSVHKVFCFLEMNEKSVTFCDCCDKIYFDHHCYLFFIILRTKKKKTLSLLKEHPQQDLIAGTFNEKSELSDL